MMKSEFRKVSRCLAYFIAGILVTMTAHADSELCQAQHNSHWQQGAIEGALLYHPSLHTAELKVQVINQRAQLSGYVDSAVNRALAEQVALNVPGIDQVVNQLEIRPDFIRPAFSDAPAHDGINYRLSNVTISNKVKSQLLANRYTSGIDLDVETHNRTVIIRGAVGSEAERQLAYLVVKNTQGVKEVVNKLSVNATENIHVGVQGSY